MANDIGTLVLMFFIWMISIWLLGGIAFWWRETKYDITRYLNKKKAQKKK